MTVKLSPLYIDAQLINGIPANGAKVFCYAAGSTTKQNTYTDSTGTVAQANPIILNSRGEPANPIWLTVGQSYKFVFTASTDSDPPASPIRTIDNVTGVNDASVTLDQWVVSGVTPTYVSATQFTVPGDQTSNFTVNRRIKATVTAGTVYGYITVSAYAALTTVTVLLDSGALDSGLSAVQLGLLTPTNDSLPQNFKPPFVDSTAIIKGSTDATKLLSFEVDTNQTTGVTRTVTTQNVSGTMGLVEDGLGAINATVGSNAMTLTINPCAIPFRSSTLGSGTVNIRAVNTAITTVISSGSTGGTVSAVPSRIAVLAIDNAGTVEVAWCNASGSVLLDESTLISTTAEGGAGAADSANIIYSTTARSNVPFKIRGYVDSTQATAGTWATAPSTIQGWGGQSSIAKASQIILGAITASTSSTSIDYTGIPIWAKRITINFSGVSTNGTANYLVQIGDSGGIEATGYLGASSALPNAGAIATTNYTTGFGITTGSAALVIHGSMTLTLLDALSNVWCAASSFGRTDAVNIIGAGAKTLTPGPLDRVRITTSNGTDTFDAGSINIMYE